MSTTMTYGPIAMVPKGDWVSGTSYVKLNLVRYQGATWICTAATNSVAPPSDPSTTTSNSYWMLLNKDLNYNNTIYDLAVDSSDNTLKYKKSTDNSTVSTGLKFSNSTTNSDNISSSSLKVIPATDTTGKLPYNFIPEATISNGVSTLGGVVKTTSISDSSDDTTVPTSLAVKTALNSTFSTGSVTTTKLADDAVTAAKVKDGETLPVNITGSAAYCSGNCAGSAAYATSAGNADTVDGQHFSWSGQSGQPSWLWGSNSGTNNYVWNPANFSVNYANTAGSASSASNCTNAYYLDSSSIVLFSIGAYGSYTLPSYGHWKVLGFSQARGDAVVCGEYDGGARVTNTNGDWILYGIAIRCGA